ncbi:MAG: alcohol dehydrogenase catalytic domain-containing protein [Granulosicoccus sp.]|nr:alcohol dehydrogenase catalytic domain-containing protein [Granulosicoccus sp.]
MNTAAFIHGARDIRLGPIARPEGDSAKTIVDVQSVGICGSDLHYYKDGGIGSAVISDPFVPGHEFSATLQEDIEPLGLRKGQLVAVDPAKPCYQCEWCERGHHNLCPNVVFLGAPPINGALTNEIAVPHESLIELPETINRDQAAMLEPLGVCIHAIDLARPLLLESVAVIGCGPIGLGILQLLKLAGVGDIIAIDPQIHRVGLAKQLGARYTGSDVSAVLDHTDGLGCHLVIEATNSPMGFADSVTAARIGSRVVLVGIPDGDLYDGLKAAEARRRGLTVKFSRRMGNVYPRAIELVSNRKIDVDILVSHRFDLTSTADAFAMQADQVDDLIKSIVYPDGLPANV